MLVELVRLLRGYVVFEARGKFTERLLNITSQRGIALWNALPQPGVLTGAMSASEYRRIRPVASKAKVRLRIKQKRGFPFFVKKYKPRVGIPIGGVLGLALMLFLSNFIWTVNISGAEHISNTEVVDALEENGVRIGAYKGSVDPAAVKRDLLLKIDGLGWMSLNLTGSTAQVELKEMTDRPKTGSTLVPCNIKAAKDGVITKVNAKTGTSVVKKGSGVTKGELLVSGVVPSENGINSYLHADAEVYADVISKLEIKIPKSHEYYFLTENYIDRRRLCLFGVELPFSASFRSFENSAFYQRSKSLCINNTSLPLCIKTQTECEAVLLDSNCDKAKAEKICANELAIYEAFKTGGSITDRKIKMTEDKNSFCFEADYILNENIAQSVDFSVTE